jgi:hypothetical protein
VGLGGGVLNTTPSGSLELGTIVVVNPGAWASTAAALGVVATASFLGGLQLVLRVRRRRREKIRDDAIIRETERENLARLLEMRIEHLQEELDRQESLPERLARSAVARAGGRDVAAAATVRSLVVIPEASPTTPDASV